MPASLPIWPISWCWSPAMAAIRRRQLPRQRPTLIPPSLPVWCSTRGCEMPREVKFLQHRKQLSAIASVVLLALAGKAHALDIDRSEEHTSELQSLMRISYAVFCLKKKKYKHVGQPVCSPFT